MLLEAHAFSPRLRSRLGHAQHCQAPRRAPKAIVHNLDEDMRKSRAQVQQISAMLVDEISIIEEMQRREKHKGHEDSSASRDGPNQDKEDKAAAHSSDKHRTTLVDINGIENWSKQAAAPRSDKRKTILLVPSGQRERETKV